jgi:hypothetical protein
MQQSKELKAETIIDLLHQHRHELYQFGARRLGLFGSYARGEQTSTSDLDFVVMLAKPSYRQYTDVRFFLEDLFGLPVDLVTDKGIKPELRSRILSEVIYVEGLQDLSE